MAEPSNEEVARAYVAAYAANDLDRHSGLRHADWYVDYPQSGERIRGDANMRAISTAFPGGLPESDPERPWRVVGSEDQWVTTPAYTIQRVAGSGDSWWADGTITYADGSTWFMVIVLELRDGRVWHETIYFAEPFDAPEWRAPFVEPIG